MDQGVDSMNQGADKEDQGAVVHNESGHDQSNETEEDNTTPKKMEQDGFDKSSDSDSYVDNPLQIQS